MLRHPVELFRSMYDYLDMGKYYYNGTSLEDYACAPKVGPLTDRRMAHIGRNQMMWDLGMDHKDFDDTKGKKL